MRRSRTPPAAGGQARRGSHENGGSRPGGTPRGVSSTHRAVPPPRPRPPGRCGLRGRRGGTWTGKALDVGTGKGLLAVALARLGMEVWSVDVDRAETELASYLADREGLSGAVRFEVLDAEALPYEPASFDRVASMDCLHHLSRPEPVLLEMARVLTEGGILVLADFSPDGFELVSRVHRAEGREHPAGGISVREATVFLERAGLRPVGKAQAHLHEVSWLMAPVRGRDLRGEVGG